MKVIERLEKAQKNANDKNLNLKEFRPKPKCPEVEFFFYYMYYFFLCILRDICCKISQMSNTFVILRKP